MFHVIVLFRQSRKLWLAHTVLIHFIYNDSRQLFPTDEDRCALEEVKEKIQMLRIRLNETLFPNIYFNNWTFSIYSLNCI